MMVMIGQGDPKKYLEMQRKNPQLTREEFDFVRRESKLLRDVGMEISRQAVTTYLSERVDGIGLGWLISQGGGGAAGSSGGAAARMTYRESRLLP